MSLLTQTGNFWIHPHMSGIVFTLKLCYIYSDRCAACG